MSFEVLFGVSLAAGFVGAMSGMGGGTVHCSQHRIGYRHLQQLGLGLCS
jgi:uncharacterized membrane protein YfcA